MSPSITFIHDTRKAKKNGTFPVKLRVTYRRVQRYYPTGLDLFTEEWDALHSKYLRKEQKILKEKLAYIQGKALEIADDLKQFNFDAFNKRFTHYASDAGCFSDTFKSYIAKLNKEERVGTAYTYQCSFNSLIAFKSKIEFETITPDFLNSYEKWMIEKGKSKTTIGIYLRSLRTVFNEAIDTGLISKDIYPFGKRKYQIPASRNIKKALSKAELKKLLDYTPLLGTMEQKAYDFWVFSYLCNGINMKDIAKLQFKNLHGDYLRFIRSKTERTTKTDQKEISIYLLPKTKEIIARWAVNENLPDNYIFPIITKGITAERERLLVQQFIKNVNKYIRRIGTALEIDKDITTYTARHSYSTVLKLSGASIEFISEALGHSNPKTTLNYLDSFEEDTKQHFTEKLLALN